VKWPKYIAHADWGSNPRKCQVALAELVGSAYQVVELDSADVQAVAKGDLRLGAHLTPSQDGQLLLGFDFPIGLPRDYAKLAGIDSFPDFLYKVGSPPWDRFAEVASSPREISVYRPFYPMRPGGTTRAHFTQALGLTTQQLRRRCEGNDAECMFWTLGGKQVGKAALAGWKYLSAAAPSGVRLWPFDGPLDSLLDGNSEQVIVAETYPREFYPYVKPRLSSPIPWSKRRRKDRLLWVPRLLQWAESLGIQWSASVLSRVEAGFSDGHNGEDEFDSVVGLLGMAAIVTAHLTPGVPDDDPEVQRVEGWILGRQPLGAAAAVSFNDVASDMNPVP
jgi:hypothetical protein